MPTYLKAAFSTYRTCSRQNNNNNNDNNDDDDNDDDDDDDDDDDGDDDNNTGFVLTLYFAPWISLACTNETKR